MGLNGMDVIFKHTPSYKKLSYLPKQFQALTTIQIPSHGFGRELDDVINFSQSIEVWWISQSFLEFAMMYMGPTIAIVI